MFKPRASDKARDADRFADKDAAADTFVCGILMARRTQPGALIGPDKGCYYIPHHYSKRPAIYTMPLHCNSTLYTFSYTVSTNQSPGSGQVPLTDGLRRLQEERRLPGGRLCGGVGVDSSLVTPAFFLKAPLVSKFDCEKGQQRFRREPWLSGA